MNKLLTMQNHLPLPLLAMIFLQVVFAGMVILSKEAIGSGLKPSIFAAYRQVVATLVLAPFAYYDRKGSPLTWGLLFRIFIVSTFGWHLSMVLNFTAVNYASPTFLSATFCLVPTFAFVIAVVTRLERVALTSWQGQAKVIGLLLGLVGTAIFSFYRGPPLYKSSQHHNLIARSYTKGQTIKGCIMAVMSQITYAIWIVMQVPLLIEYKANLRLMVLQCFFGSISTAIYSAAVERHASSWKLGWNIQLVTIIYCGILLTATGCTLQVWVAGKKGPVYPVIFNPLCFILVAIVSAVFFHETLHVGSVLGSFLLVAGLYSFLWAKKSETEEQKLEASKEETQLESMVTSNGCIENDGPRRLNINPHVLNTNYNRPFDI